MTTMDFARLDGALVTNQDEEKLGKVAGLFVDDTSGVPTWVSVTSGLFGAHHYLLPLAESRFDGEVLWVPYSKDDLAAAPPHDPDVPLTVEEEQLLYDDYNVGYGTDDTTGPHTGMGVDQTGLVAAPDSGAHPVDADSAEVARVPRLRRYAPPGRPF
jgi:PRC-barrel domain